MYSSVDSCFSSSDDTPFLSLATRRVADRLFCPLIFLFGRPNEARRLYPTEFTMILFFFNIYVERNVVT